MRHVKCKYCNKEINDKMDIHYREDDCEFFCSKECVVEDYIKEFGVVKVEAENVRKVDKFKLFKNGEIYHSNIEDDSCYKCENGTFMFSKMIKENDIDYEIYKCNKCGNEIIIKCD